MGGACGLFFYHTHYANEHALNHCKVENAATIHVPKDMKATCPEARCGQEWENTEKGKVRRDAHVSSQHSKGRGSCSFCGMQWRGTYKHKGMCTGNDEHCAGSTPSQRRAPGP